MCALYAGEISPWIEVRFLKIDDDGNLVANALGFIYSYQAGSTTPLATYTTQDIDPLSVHTNPIVLDANGRPPHQIYLAATGYKFVVKDSDLVTLYTADYIENVGQTFASTLGTVQTDGTLSVVSGYTVVETDRLVTVDSTGGASPCVINLPAAADFSNLLTIKNLGTTALAVTPNGTELVDSLNAAFTVAAASSPTFPAILLCSDGVSSWWIISSHP